MQLGPQTAAIASILVVYLLAAALLGPRRYARTLVALRTHPRLLAQFYLRTIHGCWLTFLAVPAMLVLEPKATAAGLGWRAPAGDGLDYGLTAILLVALAIVAARRRRLDPERFAKHPAFVTLPRTRGQRWLAAGVAFAAGISEEAVYRGLLIAVGVGLLGLSTGLSALLALLLFAFSHIYQGFYGFISSLVLGGVFTGVYLISGSVILPMVLHIAFDLMALLATPKQPSADLGDAPAPERAHLTA